MIGFELKVKSVKDDAYSSRILSESLAETFIFIFILSTMYQQWQEATLNTILIKSHDGRSSQTEGERNRATEVE